MLKSLEHNEHAGHMAHGGEHGGHGDQDSHGAGAADKGLLFSARLAALLVSCLAAGLAISEQGAKHAEIKVMARLVDATDAWAQYQAKSTRAATAKDFVMLMGALDPAAGRDAADRRKQAIAELNADQERYEHDPKDGKEAIAHRAHGMEHARDHALEQTHAYHNGSAAFELGIVLATASAIIGSRALICIAAGLGVIAAGLGVVGTLCALAGYVAPEWGSF